MNWRLLDTGLRSAAENIALNQALLQAQQQKLAPPTLRFLRFKPSALLGFHQSADQELHIDFCKEHQIEIQRRITGGGAIYFDEQQLGWELYFQKNTLGIADMGQLAEKICQAAAQGLQLLGVDAQFRPRNDIEVQGRKISGTGGVFDGDAVLYQGTLLIDFDIEKMLKVLNIPAIKLADKGLASAKERIITLKALLPETPSLETVYLALQKGFAQGLEIDFTTQPLLTEEEQLYQSALAEINTEDWIYQQKAPLANTPMLSSQAKFTGGLIKVQIWIDNAREHIKQVWYHGDFFVQPKRLILDLEASLKDIPIAQLETKIQGFFTEYKADMLSLSAKDFIQVTQQALEQRYEKNS